MRSRRWRTVAKGFLVEERSAPDGWCPIFFSFQIREPITEQRLSLYLSDAREEEMFPLNKMLRAAFSKLLSCSFTNSFKSGTAFGDLFRIWDSMVSLKEEEKPQTHHSLSIRLSFPMENIYFRIVGNRLARVNRILKEIYRLGTMVHNNDSKSIIVIITRTICFVLW